MKRKKQHSHNTPSHEHKFKVCLLFNLIFLNLFFFFSFFWFCFLLIFLKIERKIFEKQQQHYLVAYADLS